MNKSEILVKHNSSTSFLANILIPILGLHVLPRKDTLFELKIDTILAQNFREDLTFHLLDEFVNGVAEGEVSFVGWMRVQV
jgi:hypothetical protein